MLTLGSLNLPHPFVQAALAGYSDPPMRRLARQFGAAYTLGEVILDRCVTHKGKWQTRLLSLAPDDHPVGAQLMGATPEHFGPAARLLVNAGYDVIDINFGCPVKKVLGRCRGGFLLSQPAVALDIVRGVLDAVAGDRPVTVKMRRGMDDSAESERSFFAILEGAFALGVAAVTVHGRTVRQRYVGPSDWDFVARVKQYAGERMVLGSGDLFSAPACLHMLARTGVNGVSIARGAIGNPWIFRECLALAAGQPMPEPPRVVEQGEVIAAHYALAIAHYGPDTAGRNMRKFGIRYADLHPQRKQVRAAFIAVKTPADLAAALAEWYDPKRPWPPVVRRPGPASLIAAGARC